MSSISTIATALKQNRWELPPLLEGRPVEKQATGPNVCEICGARTWHGTRLCEAHKNAWLEYVKEVPFPKSSSMELFNAFIETGRTVHELLQKPIEDKTVDEKLQDALDMVTHTIKLKSLQSLSEQMSTKAPRPTLNLLEYHLALLREQLKLVEGTITLLDMDIKFQKEERDVY